MQRINGMAGKPAKPKKPIKHGTVGAYTNRKCRCGRCRKVWAAYNSTRRLERDPVNAEHGTSGGYSNYGCRCDRCKAAWAAERAARRAATRPTVEAS